MATNTRKVMTNSVGIIHRSLRPTNLVIVPHLRNFLMYGIARAGSAVADPAHTMSFHGPKAAGQPTSTFGSPVTRLVASYVPSEVVSHTLGITLNPVVHWYHEEFAHSVIGLRHSGHCSAPMTIWPSPLVSVQLSMFWNAW